MITNTSRSVRHIGNGSATEFPFTFKVPTADDLRVYLYDSTTPAQTEVDAGDYSVTGIGEDAGGEVTYPLVGSPIDSDTWLVIVRVVDYTQEVNLSDQGALFLESMEEAMDKLVMMAQQLVEEQTRMIKLNEGEAFTIQLTDKASLANKILAFDADGEPIATEIGNGSAITLPLAINQGGTGQITAALARTALGAAAAADLTTLQTNLAGYRVRVATTAAITIATALNNGDTLDGVVLATGDIVLVKDQAAPAQNGVYVVGAVPARHGDFDTWADHPGRMFFVQEGTLNADKLFLCTADLGGTLDTTALTFATPKATNAQLWSAALDRLVTTDLIETAAAPVALADAVTIAVNWDEGINRETTLGGNRTLGNPTNGQPGTWRTFKFTQDGTGSRTLAYGNQYHFAGGVEPVLSTAAGSIDFLMVYCVTTTLFYGFISKDHKA